MEIITLLNQYQTLTILSTGATIHEWRCFNDRRNIVISNADLNDYKKTNMGFLNQTIGRVANRIKDGKFSLNGKDYQLSRNFKGGHHGHGGPSGFYLRDFEVLEKSNEKVVFKYISSDLEEGYPGILTLLVKYELVGEKFIITYEATSSEDTIINITNHAHFNLSLEDTILNHKVEVSAPYVLEIDEDLIPTGVYKNVLGTPFDLTKEVELKRVIKNKEVQNITQGLDHAFVFGDKKQIHLKYQNKHLMITTDYPGVQIYSMNYPLYQKLLDREYVQHAGIAFEPQYEPNAINIPQFSQPVLRAGDRYLHQITYHIFED